MANEQTRNLVSRRGNLKSQLTRFTSFVNDTNNHSKIIELSTRLQRIEIIYDEFNVVQDQLEMDDSSNEQLTEISEFENKFFSIVAQTKQIIDDNKKKNIQNIANSPTPVLMSGPGALPNFKSVQLPPISLPHFDGTYETWSTFYDTFNSIVNQNTNLSNVEKFYYLQSSLKGDAARNIDSLVINDENYTVAWNLMKERYENKKFIIRGHMKQIFELPNIVKDSQNSFRSFLDKLQRHYRALKHLGESVDSWSTILIYLLLSKLDVSTKREWEIKTRDEVSPTTESFIKFLNDRCQLLESIDNKFRDKNNIKTQVHVASNRSVCSFCKGDHSIYYCKEFIKLSVNARFTEIKRLKACTNCLRIGHFVDKCTMSSCRHCGKKHNTLLHINKQQQQPTASHVQSNNTLQDNTIGFQSQDSFSNNRSFSNPNNFLNNNSKSERSRPQTNVVQIDETIQTVDTDIQSCSKTVTTHCADGSFTILPTALVYMYDYEHKPFLCRALLDSGSQSNFITEDLQNKLQLKINKIDLPIVGINSVQTNISKSVSGVVKSTLSDDKFNLNFLIIDKITDNIPQSNFNTSSLLIPKDVKLADPNFNHSSEIHMLLGANIFYHLLLNGQIKFSNSKTVLQNTKLGWVVSGSFFEYNSFIRPKVSHCHVSQYANLEKQLELFWLIEDCSEKQQVYTKEEKDCELHFQNTFKREKSGKFLVQLPFRDNFTQIGNSDKMAIQRFQTLERKLERNSELKEKYRKFMAEYLELGHMSPIYMALETQNQQNFYLPHHCVLKDSSLTTKLRVVFDASAKSTSDLSLNDVLKVGPCIQEQIFSILLRFRLHSIVFTADITKMYRCINIREQDRNYQRIVWRADPTEPLVHYKLNTVTYGTAPASFLATRCLKQLAIDNISNFPFASKSILSNFYMDDWLDGSDDIDTALLLVRNVDDILKSGGFNLRQWSSNDKRILEHFQNDISSTNSQYVVKDDQSCKTLGILWNSIDDCFQYAANPETFDRITKRSILSVISQIFDPLGLIGPVIITAKILLQKLWQLRLGWDDPIPQNLLDSWLKFFQGLSHLKEINIPCQVLIKNHSKIELHCFSDASINAYGACIYLRSINESGDILVRLVVAKSRVAPLKTITLPRLELCGALLSTRLCQSVDNALKTKFHDIKFWTDSTIVLAWIATDASKLKTFVSNRISQIQGISKLSQWRHVPTRSNPADLISRGLNPKDILNSRLWFEGPQWLSMDETFWPSNKIIQGKSISDLGVAEIKNEKAITCTVIENSMINVISRYSTLTKLLRVVAFMLRFKTNLCCVPELRNFSKLPKLEEIDNANLVVVKIVQSKVFANEIGSLRGSNSVSRNSKILSLNPFLDKDGIMRVGGRLKHSILDFDSKYPIIIPAKHHFTTLVIRNSHLKNLHAGPQAVLSEVRTKYWPLGGRRTVRSVLQGCIICFRANPSSILQKMGDLPNERVTPSAPFSKCGIDYAGPYTIKDSKFRNKKYIKVYICIFICLSTKAVHMELASELSTDSFLNALKRFISRRGLCTDIHSDNATNFVGADKFIVNQFNEIKFQRYLLENMIRWHFIPARSPHFGGLWESAVRLAKYHLKRVLNNIHFTYEDFYTLIVQIESILNSRPLYPLTENPQDLGVLTPGHFLIGRPMLSLPERQLPESRHTFVSRYRHLTFIIQQFWRTWSRDYLSTLQTRCRWQMQHDHKLSAGTLVILKEDHTPPQCWKLGRIIETYPGEDGLIRVVLVKTVDGTYKRAITKICVLPMDNNTSR